MYLHPKVSLVLQLEVVRTTFQRTETGLCGIGVKVWLKDTSQWAQLKYGFIMLEGGK